MYRTRIAVIGAGTIGVSTAYNIIQSIPNVEVTLIADQFSPNTTSDLAAGHWRPHRTGDTPEHRLTKWGKETWDFLIKLAMSDISKDTGTCLVSGRELYLGMEDDPFWKDMVIGFRRLSDAELRLYPDRYKSGYFYTTIVCDQTKYIPWLTAKFTYKGGIIKQMKVKGFNELNGYDVVVNCTGIGSRDLCGDLNLQPLRGHIIKVKAPWITHFTIAPEDHLHVLRGFDTMVLGFTVQESVDPMFHESDRKRIITGCAELEPSVANATDQRDYVGYRPVRSDVRLEVEYCSLDNKVVPIVHNYGHGGAGITLHWGCAREATNMVKSLIGNTAKI